jgi:hypothetical protein
MMTSSNSDMQQPSSDFVASDSATWSKESNKGSVLTHSCPEEPSFGIIKWDVEIGAPEIDGCSCGA